MSGRATLSTASIAAFAVATGEMFFMASPFAAYFYGLYSPLLTVTQSSPMLSWLSEFWAPHIAPAGAADAIFGLGATLAVGGSALFIVHASYLYWTKFRLRTIATRLLYSRVRHPQYGCLILAGAGFALLWPRFLNLLLFLAMCVAYYALARAEEARMKRLFPFEYAEYAYGKSMFFPRPPWLPARGRQAARTAPRTASAVVALAALVVAGAFATRTAAVRGLRTEPVPGDPSAMLITYSERLPPEVRESALALARRDSGDGARLIYVTDRLEIARHLLIDSGIRKSTLVHFEGATADFYAIRAIVPGSGPASEALRTGAVRGFEGLYALSRSGAGDFSRVPLPEAERYRHAAVPLL